MKTALAALALTGAVPAASQDLITPTPVTVPKAARLFDGRGTERRPGWEPVSLGYLA